MKSKLLNRYTAVEGGCSYFGAVAAYALITLIFGLLNGMLEGGTGALLLSFAANILIQGCFLAAALIPAKGFHSRITHLPTKTTTARCLVGAGAAVICIVGFEGLALSFNTALQAGGYSPSSSLDFSDPLVVVLTIVQSVIFAPVCEELLFRGSVLSSLEVLGKNRGKGSRFFSVVMCGALFALIHCNPMQTVYQFFLGCAAAYITISFGSLIPAMLLHAMNNLLGVILSTPAIDGAIGGWLTAVFSTGWSIALFVVCSVLLAVGGGFAIWALCKVFGEKKQPRKEINCDLSADEHGGGMSSALVFVPGALICIALWIETLVRGLSAGL